MAVHNQPITLVASPSYPNSIVWSKENLVAVASGHLITILNPASPVRPRGLIKLPSHLPFPFGVVKREDLFATCMVPISLSRDARPCARSVSWSYPGFAPNGGCLLAVCTTEGRVKLYRAPFCEFCPEWVEVVDISDLLYHYLKRINFREPGDPSATSFQGHANVACLNATRPLSDLQDSIPGRLPDRRKRKTCSRFQKDYYRECLDEELTDNGDDHIAEITCDKDDGPARSKKSKIRKGVAINPCSNLKQSFSAEKTASREGGITQDATPHLITPEQYASRSALLSSLIVAWSPTLESSGEHRFNFTNHCSILAVGGKSGNISLWRICEPQSYSIEHVSVPVDPVLIGLLQAHGSWITAISWGIHAASSSESQSQLVLVTGSCDGSVKIWLGDVDELIKSSESDKALFLLLREVTAVTNVPVSTVSLAASASTPGELVLAIGRGSGSLEIWIYHLSCNKLQTAGVYNAHNQVVTGLSWAFDGCCLYSCSQDNSVHSWVLDGSSLHETSFPANFPGQKSSIDLSQVSDLCFGLALSPGGLMVAVVRSFDSELLDRMYQARIQKAAVEFYWNCGQLLGIPSNKHLNGDIESLSNFFRTDLEDWESTILWSLKRYESVGEPLVLWDVLMALRALDQSIPSLVENLLFKWMSSWFADFQLGDSLENLLLHMQNMLPKMGTRRMHLLNIICRRLMLGEIKPVIQPEECHDLSGLDIGEGKLDLWTTLLVNCERELQERFVCFTFKAVLSCASTTHPTTDESWSPVGVAQMEQWVATSPTLVHDQLKFFISKVGELGSRIRSVCEYVNDETCSYCSAMVPFESVGVARCEGITQQDGSRENHELKRCSVSMKLVSIVSPMWFCMCCERLALHLPPVSFFTMSESSLDVNYEGKLSPSREQSRPLCLFCGVLLQRFLPDFLLSQSLV